MTFSEHKHFQSSLSDLSTTFQQMHTILERLPGNFPSHLLFIKLLKHTRRLKSKSVFVYALLGALTDAIIFPIE